MQNYIDIDLSINLKKNNIDIFYQNELLNNMVSFHHGTWGLQLL